MDGSILSSVRSPVRPGGACRRRGHPSGSAGARSGSARPAARRTRDRASVKRSPAAGIRPAHSASRPATVVERPGAARRRTRSSIASREMLPSVSRSAGPAVGAAADTRSSCSSKISPTSSSSRSSSVAMPRVPPNSSSTTARCRRSRCMSSSRSPQVRLAGVIATGRIGQRIARAELEEVERVQHADDVVQRAADRPGCRLYPLWAKTSRMSSSGGVLLDRHDVGARRHHLPHRPHAERHDAADHRNSSSAPSPTAAPSRQIERRSVRRGRAAGPAAAGRAARDHGRSTGMHPVGHRLRARPGQPAGHEICRDEREGHRGDGKDRESSESTRRRADERRAATRRPGARRARSSRTRAVRYLSTWDSQRERWRRAAEPARSRRG